MKKILLLFLISTISFSQEKYNLKVNVKNISEVKGKIFCALFNKEDGFLIDNKRIFGKMVEVKSDNITIDLGKYSRGNYAIVLFQDMNGNKKLDKMWFPPIPKEPYGFSNNPSIIGKPKWEECKFSLTKDLEVNIKLND